MLVKDILVFIKELKGLENLTPCDIHLHDTFVERFGHRSPQEKIKFEDVQWLLQSFKYRCMQVIDTEYDYTLNADECNQKWIQFAKELAPIAKELAPHTNMSFLEIILPIKTNTVDYNNLSLLSETTRLVNFYIGQDRTVLYRTRGLCEHLIKQKLVLSTCRDIRTRKLSPLSIDEMTRLESSSHVKNKFSINEDEFFDNFWDFLRKKVFPKLQSKDKDGKLPRELLELLPHLLMLIEKYYKLKKDKADFKEFKQACQIFFYLIYKNKLENVNYFYGIKIPYKGKDIYLLDFLIIINKAKSYTLNEYLDALIEWLYKFHPSLKATSEELRVQYSKLERTNLVWSSDVGAKYLKKQSKSHCFEFLLSLFTRKFELLPLSGNTISLWDMSTTVFSEAAEMFQLFMPLLVNDRIDDLDLMYEQVLNDYIIPGGSDVSFCTWLTRFQSVKDWYKQVESNSLSDNGVYWFPPELLMHALLRFKTNNSIIRSQVNEFLDDLVHTYAQENSELLKQLRVNILFSNFMKIVPSHERRYLLILIKLCERYDIKSSFVGDCVYHIVNRLSQMSIVKAGGAVHFFSGSNPVDIAKLVVPELHPAHLNEVIDNFKARLHSSKLKLDTLCLEKATAYIHSLLRPIFTLQEQQDDRVRTLDYLGAPS